MMVSDKEGCKNQKSIRYFPSQYSQLAQCLYYSSRQVWKNGIIFFSEGERIFQYSNQFFCYCRWEVRLLNGWVSVFISAANCLTFVTPRFVYFIYFQYLRVKELSTKFTGWIFLSLYSFHLRMDMDQVFAKQCSISLSLRTE